MFLICFATSPPHKGTAPPQPETIEINCSPFCSQVTGDPTIPEPTWNVYKISPVSSSNANNLPSGVPVNTSPPAVVKTPPHNGAGFLYSHFTFPVNGSIAFKEPIWSSKIGLIVYPAPK